MYATIFFVFRNVLRRKFSLNTTYVVRCILDILEDLQTQYLFYIMHLILCLENREYGRRDPSR
jgi:hypothetical protein